MTYGNRSECEFGMLSRNISEVQERVRDLLSKIWEMREKLKELSEILKQKNPAIKERLKYQHKFIDWCFVEVEPAYHDILEYLGEDYYMNTICIWWYDKDWESIELFLDTWPLSLQLDTTLDEIISLCKNVWNK